MSRSGYSDDCDHLALWRGAVDAALAGRRGQMFLKEMAAAMDAMPDKKLIAHDLIDADGCCCAMGVVCQARGIDVSHVDAYDPRSVGRTVGIASAMAAEIAFMNDEWASPRETPAERWTRMRQWVREHVEKERSANLA